jgi:hypothetical protein
MTNEQKKMIERFRLENSMIERILKALYEMKLKQAQRS